MCLKTSICQIYRVLQSINNSCFLTEIKTIDGGQRDVLYQQSHKKIVVNKFFFQGIMSKLKNCELAYLEKVQRFRNLFGKIDSYYSNPRYILQCIQNHAMPVSCLVSQTNTSTQTSCIKSHLECTMSKASKDTESKHLCSFILKKPSKPQGLLVRVVSKYFSRCPKEAYHLSKQISTKPNQCKFRPGPGLFYQ